MTKIVIPDDLTIFHSEAKRLREERDAAIEERDRQMAQKDNAYEERNRLVALLSAMFPSGVKRTDIPGWNPEWHGAVYIDFPWGQASWHFHDSQSYLFSHLPPYGGEWDGHTTEGKYEAIRAASLSPSIIGALREELATVREVNAEQASLIAYWRDRAHHAEDQIRRAQQDRMARSGE